MNDLEPNVLHRFQSLLNSDNPPVCIDPLQGDASTRRYFRAHYADDSTTILTLYPEAGKSQEDTFLDVQRFLKDLGLPVPEVLFNDKANGLVVLEDLGDNLLEGVVPQSSEAQIQPLYEQAVDLLLDMRRATDGLTSGCVAYTLAFDMEKLMWEMDFFMTHFIRGLCKLEPTQQAESTLNGFFKAICSILAAEPRVFTHRDYHSRNLMVHNDRLVMIDFQDARMGPAQYDLASLLRDSYVTLPEDLVSQLQERYFASLPPPREISFQRFRHIFDVMSLQRNIKALGSFGYQLSQIGNFRYQTAIPRTAAYIARTIENLSEYLRYRPVVEEYICGPVMEMDSPE